MAKKKNADSMEWQKAISLFTEKINEIYGDDTDSLMKDLADFSKKEDALRDECKVTADDWSHSHPFGLSAASDRFYAGLASDIWRDITIQLFMPGIPDGVTRLASIMMAAYLEDIISNTESGRLQEIFTDADSAVSCLSLRSIPTTISRMMSTCRI